MILIIEADHDSADSLRDVLELHGLEAEVAYTAADGLAKARKLHPEVVLCDIGLPGTDGYEIARNLRRDPRTATIRLVALTGCVSDKHRRLAKEAGFDVHVGKPAETDRLLRLVDRALRGRIGDDSET